MAQAPADLTARVTGEMRLRSDLDPKAPATWYAVPALSPVKRLPGAYPADGELGGAVRVVAARGEAEAASFLVFPFQTAGKAELTVSALKAAAGVIPAARVDVKVVTCWYQAGTAWHSYFADVTGRQMTPELLLNDETLIRVDETTKDNYLRVDDPAGPAYVWISNPAAVDVPFNAETTPVADAPTLQPFRLEAGQFKQFWVTVKVPEDAAPGLYQGALALSTGAGKPVSIPLSVRVLPFALPAPLTYYDSSREFYTMLYNDPQYADILGKNGGDWAHADRKTLALFTNMREHNILHPRIDDYRSKNRDAFIRNFELMREAGLSTDPIFGAIPGIPPFGWMTSVTDVAISNQTLPQDLVKAVDESADIVKTLFNHSNVYCFGWDEPSRRLVVAERKPWQYIHDKGLKIYSTAQDSHLAYSGYNEDFVNIPGAVTRERAAAWHALGHRITTYAGPHTGPENPDFMRRIHGLTLYKAHYDGLGNYILACATWNDFVGESYNFRLFNMTYPTRDGVIDTLAWEATREAIDDVRYATLLKTMAEKAMAVGTTESGEAGRRALLWLERLNAETADLNTARLEMIDRILALRAYADFPAVPRRVAARKASPLAPPAPATGAVAVAVNAAPGTVEACRAAMAKPKVSIREYRVALLKLIELQALGGTPDDARATAEAASADVKLANADRLLAAMVAAGLAGPGGLEKAGELAAGVVTNTPPTAEMKVAAFQEAGKLFMKMRRYDTVRACLALADGLRRVEPKKVYACPYLAKAPTTVEGWLASPFRLDPKHRESRFVAYDRKAADLLVNDVNVERVLAPAGGGAAVSTDFVMAWDEAGIRLFVECEEPALEPVKAGLMSGGQLELFLVPGWGNAYYQWFASFPEMKARPVIWDSPGPHYRPMDAFLKTESGEMDKGFGVSVFIPWEMLYDKLPAEGDQWPLNIVRWSRLGNVTWGGKVHNLTAFGTVRWEGFTPERVAAIKRSLVLKAYGNYLKAKGDPISFWKDEVLGDPGFYTASLQPVAGQLDAWGAKVQPVLAPADVDFLFANAVPGWMEFASQVARLRRDYLQEKFAK